MPRFEVLNNDAHKDLRVATHYGPEFGDAIGMVSARTAMDPDLEEFVSEAQRRKFYSQRAMA